MIFDLPEDYAKLQELIVAMCCTWWQNNIAGKDDVVPSTISFLIMKTVQPGAAVCNLCLKPSLTTGYKAASVKRVHAMKECLLLLDFDDETAGSLKACNQASRWSLTVKQAVLQQCVISPLYLTSAEVHS